MYIRLSCCSLAVCFWCRPSLQPAPECDHGWCTCRQHCLGRYFDYAQWNILQHQKSSHASAQETRMVGDRRVQDSCGLHHTAHSTNTGLVGSKVVSEVVSANIAAKAAQMIQKHVFTRRSETLFLVISKVQPTTHLLRLACMMAIRFSAFSTLPCTTTVTSSSDRTSSYKGTVQRSESGTPEE